jgi:hypothetical protein
MSVSSAGLRSAQVARAAGVSQQTSTSGGCWSPGRCSSQDAEIDARMDDFASHPRPLVSVMEVGCDDLMVCATTRDCPLPFTEIARVSAAT